jgi:hypothetical protein
MNYLYWCSTKSGARVAFDARQTRVLQQGVRGAAHAQIPPRLYRHQGEPPYPILYNNMSRVVEELDGRAVRVLKPLVPVAFAIVSTHSRR